MTGSPWLSTKEAARRAGFSVTLVMLALNAGDLVGYQRQGLRSPWRIHQDDLDAWVRGEVRADVAKSA